MIFPVLWSDLLLSPANGVVDLGLMIPRKGILRSARPLTPKQKQRRSTDEAKQKTKQKKKKKRKRSRNSKWALPSARAMSHSYSLSNDLYIAFDYCTDLICVGNSMIYNGIWHK